MSCEASDKIAILTLPGRFNYGNRLQNYAVTQLFENKGLRVESLELLQESGPVQTIKRTLKSLLGRTELSPELLMSEQRKEAFRRFDSLMQTRTIPKLDGALKDEYAFFSVGSDQVWNPSYIRHNEDWYFLKFARPEQRIALSPSIGLDDVSWMQANRIRKGVMGFSQLSVRELRGVELIRKCAGREALLTPDPTLAISRDEWRSVADARLTPADPYVFTYLLGGTSESSHAALATLLKDAPLPVIPLSDRSRQGEPHAGPSEFLSLIDNAQHVVTDSFHAAIFSVLFRTPLTIVRRGGTSMFSRLSSLSTMLHLENRIYGDPRYDSHADDEYGAADSEIRLHRDRLLSFLDGCLVSQ